MLKIKSNTNEFTIIFLRRLETKRMLKRSHSASVQFSTPSSFFYFLVRAIFCFSPLFLFSFGAPFFTSASLTFLQPSLFLFFWSVALYFSALNTFSAQTFFSPKTLFLAQNVFASAQNVFQFSPKCFFQFSATLLFFFLLYSFLV